MTSDPRPDRSADVWIDAAWRGLPGHHTRCPSFQMARVVLPTSKCPEYRETGDCKCRRVARGEAERDQKDD